MARTTFAELLSKIQSREIEPEEIRRSFVLDATKSTAFHPQFRVNREEVDVTGLEGTAADAGHALAIESGFMLHQTEAFSGPQPDGSIVAEGDSWFRLPHILYPPTMADFLAQQYPLTNLAHWGDELSQMYNGGKGQYLPLLKSKTIRFLLFSGGGNDVLGATFEQCLNVFDVGHTSPDDAAYYLTPFFYAKLREVQRYYELILDDVARFSPSTTLVVHGYDYAIPRGNGPLLGIHMQNRGLYPTFNKALCRAIVRLMIDLFNERLSYLSQHHPNFQHVDLRGTVKENQWFDGEIHPNATAAANLAKRVAKVLDPPAAHVAAMVASKAGKKARKGSKHA